MQSAEHPWWLPGCTRLGPRGHGNLMWSPFKVHGPNGTISRFHVCTLLKQPLVAGSSVCGCWAPSSGRVIPGTQALIPGDMGPHLEPLFSLPIGQGP